MATATELSEAAAEAIDCIEGLTLTGDYAGEPFVLAPFQREGIVEPLMGKLCADGRRQYKECGIWLPRKNAKTQLVAALIIYFLLSIKSQGEIYSAASEREQAGVIYRMVASMIRHNADLESIFTLVDSQKRVINNVTGTLFCSLSSEAGSKHGYNPSVVIGDEIHVWPKRDLWTALTTGSGTRREHLFITITTAGLYDKTSFEWEQYDYAKKVKEGIIEDDEYLPVIYEAPRDADWLDEDVWRACNPAIDAGFLRIDDLRKLAKKAQHIPSLENDFRRLHLNQHTAQQTRWLSMHLWDAGAREPTDFSGKACWCGLDLSTKEDITAFAALFKTETGYHLKVMMWIPRDTALDREKADRVPYLAWNHAGAVGMTEGRRVDYQQVVADIVAFGKRHSIQQIAVDPWNAEAVIQNLTGEGFKVLEVMQSFRHSNEPSRELEALLANGDLTHEANPCLDWMASNVEVARNPGGHIRPVKASETQRVDGITALVLALGRAMKETEQTSIYEQKGQLAL